MGSWLTYGLGSECEDLPGFVVLLSGGGQPDGGTSLWGSGFLPTVYQGVPFRSQGDPVLYLSNPPGVTDRTRRKTLDAIQQFNREHFDSVGDPEIETRIAAFEMAYLMQKSAPELMDVSKEPPYIRKLYGTEPGKVAFSNNCLLARRLLERGVRFVQLYHRGWDHHGSIPSDELTTALPERCRETDQACAALIKDLKQRGLLEDTLVIWGGEFGRTPMMEARNGSKLSGRDHHPKAFSMWLAGGGIRKGCVYGATDELGYHVVENKIHIHDLQATILHLMGFDHTALTFKFQGRLFRLTDVAGTVIKDIIV